MHENERAYIRNRDERFFAQHPEREFLIRRTMLYEVERGDFAVVWRCRGPSNNQHLVKVEFDLQFPFKEPPNTDEAGRQWFDFVLQTNGDALPKWVAALRKGAK